jgi:hypothetical protein
MPAGEASQDSPSLRDRTGSVWTDRRRGLQAAIAEVSGLYAELYGRAVDALSEPNITVAALVVAGHCIRDVVTGLSDKVAELGQIPPQASLKEPARGLADVWDEHLDQLSAISGANDGSSPNPAAGDSVMVPRALVVAARAVAAASRKGNLNMRQRCSLLVMGHIDGVDDPTVGLFFASFDLFEKCRHPSRTREVIVDGDKLAKLEEALQTIESGLEGSVGSFFDALDDIQDVLRAANEREQPDVE